MSRIPPPPRLLSTTEVAERLGVSTNTVRNYVAAGLISCHRVGPKLLRFDPAEVDAFARRIGTGA